MTNIRHEEIISKNFGDYHCIYYPNNSYLTNIQILTKIGSAAEQKDNQGMAHILEHMFFKGSAKRHGGMAISRAANDIGAKMNAYTSYDHTVYYISVLNDVFEQGFDILADMYLNPLFPAEEFAKELNPILSELREREDDPDSFLMERSFAKYFGDSYHPIIGTEESIRAATVEMMHDFKSKFYGGKNCLVSIVGGISQEKAFSCAEKLFQARPNNCIEPPKKKISVQKGEMILKKAGISEAYCSLLFPAIEDSHPDRFKQDMMSYLLGGNDSALLFERIREELGMSCYGIYSWVMRNEPFHVLGISCGIVPDELDDLIQEVMKQIERICASPLGEKRLKRGKASLRTSIAARAETSAGMNSMIALPILRGQTQHPLQKMLLELEAITLDDVLDLAQRTFSGPMFKAVLLPE